jgi:hypothetical protein
MLDIWTQTGKSSKKNIKESPTQLTNKCIIVVYHLTILEHQLEHNKAVYNEK